MEKNAQKNIFEKYFFPGKKVLSVFENIILCLEHIWTPKKSTIVILWTLKVGPGALK